jgi:hypothetical protein
MNSNSNNSYTNNAQALCLRGGVYVSATMALLSIAIHKDFVDHDPGGSKG